LDRVQKAAVAVACLVLSTLLLALSIDAVGEIPTLRELYASDLPVQPDLPIKPNPDTTRLDQMTGGEGSEPLLRIIGSTETSYLRLVPYDKYYSGTWETVEVGSESYTGGYVDIPVETYLSMSSVSFTVVPLSDLGQYLPTAPNTVSLNLTGLVDYLLEKQVFSSEADPQAYNLTYFRFTFSEEQLENAPVIYMPECLEVPGYLEEDLRALAEGITSGDSTAYDKLVSLRDYLMQHYEYNLSCPAPPPGTDPLEYFLYESGEGVCTHFNTALTMMARTLNISARLVGGFYIDPDALTQEVYPMQRHAFTEVPFEGLGWIIFDATPGSDLSSILDSLPGVNGTDGGSGEVPVPGVVDKPVEPIVTPSKEQLFKIFGVTGTSYLRDGVADYYNGSWYASRAVSLDYDGYYVERVVEGYDRVDEHHFYVEFNEPVEGYIPVPLVTRQLISEAALNFYPELELFSVEQGNVTGYEVLSEAPYFNETSLTSAEPYLVDRYLQIPEELNDSIRPIALLATRSPSSAYGKVRALETYLKTQYTYNLTYTHAPPEVDPVEWFLVHGRQGVCTDFSSALVLLARSIGIPSRLVTGYLIRSDAETQAVKASQAHAYVEVLFDGLGWVTFDAMPSAAEEAEGGDGRVPTFTNITYQDEYVLVGSHFTVAGTVVDDGGLGVSGLDVLIYLKQNKTESGVLAGKTTVVGGLFNASCLFPVGLPPGEYMVDAHALGDDLYLGSWSDPPIVSYTETVFLVRSPGKVVAGHRFNLAGVLLNKPTNETVSGAEYTVEVDGGAFHGVTDSEGSFNVEVSLDEPGEYPVTYSWEGSGFYLGANTVETVQSLPLVFTMKDIALVRGETSVVSGVVHADEIPGASEAVTATILGNEVSTVTDEGGGFMILCRVPSGHELGPLPMALTLHSGQLTVTPSLQVFARPRLSVAGAGPVQVGQKKSVALQLVDDGGSPISGAPIKASYIYGEETKSFDLVSDQGGSTSFDVLVAEEEGGSLVYEARFSGSGNYLAASTTGSLAVVPAPPFPLLPALAALLTIAVVGGLMPLRGRWVKKEEAETTAPATEVPAPRGLSVSFPAITPPLPNVWGVGEELGMLVLLTTPEGSPIASAPVGLVIHEHAEDLLTDGDGEAHASTKFGERGTYTVTVDYKPGGMKASQRIRVVDYREEVVKLFNSKFKEARERFKAVRENHTARELMEYLEAETPAATHSALEEMVFLFEEANYSLHPVQRGLYERFYRAMIGFEEAYVDGEED
jgi:transglutaminase-like putative cysteine protease